MRRMGNEKVYKLANFMDSPLRSLEEKGNLDYAKYLYNPNNLFDKVIHFSWHKEDRDINLGNNIELKFLRRPLKLLKPLWFIFLPICLLINIFYVFYIIKRERVNVIRGRLPYLGSLVGLIVAKINKIPIIVSLGGNNRLPQKMNKSYYLRSKFFSYRVEEIVLKNVDIILVPNDYTKNYVISITEGKMKGKIVKIPWILKRSTFTQTYEEVDIHKKFNLKRNIPLIVNIGFLSQYKYVDRLMLVIDRLVKEGYSFQLVFCGEGPLRETIRNEYLSLIGKRIFLLGWQNQNIIKNLLKNSDVTWVLMSGFVLLEAAAMGAPIITSDIEWHSEFIIDGINGYVVNPEDENEIFEKTISLLINKFIQEKFRTNARKILEKDYNPADLLNKEIKLYKELIKRESFVIKNEY